MLHLGASADYEAFANSEVLQYTMLPSLNKCNDHSYLKDSPFKSQAQKCLETLSNFIKAKLLPISCNFVKFALGFEAYSQLVVAMDG
jgi:hypothetical protein